MLLPRSLTSRALALNKETIEWCGERRGSWAVLAFGLAFDRGLIKGGETETQAAEWGLMGAELN